MKKNIVKQVQRTKVLTDVPKMSRDSSFMTLSKYIMKVVES